MYANLQHDLVISQDDVHVASSTLLPVRLEADHQNVWAHLADTRCLKERSWSWSGTPSTTVAHLEESRGSISLVLVRHSGREGGDVAVRQPLSHLAVDLRRHQIRSAAHRLLEIGLIVSQLLTPLGSNEALGSPGACLSELGKRQNHVGFSFSVFINSDEYFQNSKASANRMPFRKVYRP